MDAIVNIREIPVGSFVEVWTSDMNVLTCQVAEVLLGDKVRVLILHQSYDFGQYASFRFKSTFSKSYVRISCVDFHRLQNIMRFLTGGELEFEYKI